MNETIDVEATTTPANQQPQNLAVQRMETGAVGRAMTIDELHKNLEFIRDVMRKEMKEGQDYGKIPGAGDKPTLLQPGAQKLLMTFNLTENVKKEVLREYPNLHREYEFTVTVASGNGKTWDGVGTCSTLESKYRYRKAQRKCPACGKNTIIEGKAEYGGGFVCWKKKGGCDSKFRADDQRITSQPTGDTENEDPADQWNTVRKMAFKRALVAAAINATNTSELWTQDVEDMNLDGSGPKRPQGKPAPAAATSSRPAPASAKAPPKPAQAPPQNKPAAPEKRYPTDTTRAWLIKRLEPCRDLAIEYFRKLDKPAVLLPNETLENLPLQFLPIDLRQAKLLDAAITDFGNGDDAKHAFPANELKPVEKPKDAAKPAPPPATTLRPPSEPNPVPHKPVPPANGNKQDPEWFFDIIVTVPPKGVKRVDYLKAPDTIRSLYTRLKEGDEAAGRRLWGFVNHYEAKSWVGNDGQERPPSNADLVFRDALDAFAEWHEKNGKDTVPNEAQPEPAADENEDDDIPF